MPDKPKSFGQFDQGPGQRYATKPKKPKKKSTADGRRTPRRDKQVARGKGMSSPSESDVRRAMSGYRSRVLRGGS